MRKRISMPDRDFMKAAKGAAKSGLSLKLQLWVQG